VAGLRLQITATGNKSWVLRTTVGAKRKVIGLGAYPEVSLAEARIRARDARAKVVAGVDPVEEKRAARAALIAAAARNLGFTDAVDKWMEAKMQHRPEKSRKAIKATIARYALPELKGLTVQQVTSQDIVRAISEVWSEKPDTGQKLRSYLEGILTWATVSGLRTGDNPARWGGNLKELLPAPSQVEKGRVGNFPALAQKDLSAWWAELAQREGMGAATLRFAVLCASRSGEVRGATWDEIDLDAAMWVIPPARMKMGREHRVPLSEAAVELLRAVPKTKGAPYLFPSATGKMISDMSISAVMRRMQADAEDAALARGEPVEQAGWRDARSGKPAVPHGLRSTFRDWAAEGGWDRDLAEIALAHQVGSAVERAYRRSDMVERRREMMTAWSATLEGKSSGMNVLPFIRSAG
jgi:integrase